MPSYEEYLRYNLVKLMEYNGSTANSTTNSIVPGIPTNWKELTKNPDWKMQVAKDQDASGNYLRRISSFLPAVGRYKSTRYNISFPGVPLARGKGFIIHAGASPFIVSGTSDSTTRDIALSKLKRKLNNRTQSFNAMIPLAEIRDLRRTVKGAVDLTANVVGSLRDVKKGRFKDAWKRVSNIWLTYSFGVRPMMKDIHDIGQSITAFLERQDITDRLASQHTKTWKSRSVSTGQDAGFYVTLSSTADIEHTLSYRFITGHKFLLRSATDYTAADHFGFSPPKLIPTLWELTAFSWVLDYFGTIGDFLDDTFSGTTGNSIYVIENRRYLVKWRADIQFSGYMDQYNPFLLTEVSTQNAQGEYMEFQRTRLAALPGRVLRFRTLDEMGLNGVTKLLNLTSVLAGFSR
jgi:hypothetical protein